MFRRARLQAQQYPFNSGRGGIQTGATPGEAVPRRPLQDSRVRTRARTIGRQTIGRTPSRPLE
jgi:hypothetical protein